MLSSNPCSSSWFSILTSLLPSSLLSIMLNLFPQLSVPQPHKTVHGIYSLLQLHTLFQHFVAKKSAMESWWYFIFSTFSLVWSSRNYNVCDHVCVSLLCSDKFWVEWECKTKCQGEILPLTYDWVRYNLTKPIFFACLFHFYNYMPYLSNCNIQHSILLQVQ